MITTNAIWEKDNFNKNVLEIQFEPTDTKDCLDTLSTLEKEFNYILAKVPKMKIDLAHRLEEHEFRFLETQISLSYNLKKHKSLEQKNRIQFKQLHKPDDLDVLIASIDLGLFLTDRVAIDPTLGIEYANTRYINWIKNDFENKATKIIEASIDNRKMGFFYLKDRGNNVIDAVLFAIYQDSQKRGYTVKVMEQMLVYLAKEGYTRVETKVSSNNIEILKLHLSLGLRVENVNYIFRKCVE